MSDDVRIESDSMGDVEVPSWAYWGAQTQRAVENFGVSAARIPIPMIRALALIKKHGAAVNGELGLVDPSLSEAIAEAASEVLSGRWDDHFPIDVFQTGSGTSWNMNVNEVISNRANVLLGHQVGERHPVHPNDHVNQGQSSNDVIPTAIHLANRIEGVRLVTSLIRLRDSLRAKAEELSEVVKIGRTHLQDAVPMTLGQEFSGFAEQVAKGVTRVKSTFSHLEELALGGTAIGTGINCHPEFAQRVTTLIAEETGIPFRIAGNLFEAIACRDAQLELMGALNTVVSSLMKIANDLRLLASGPRAGLGEIMLPSLQPGSSIMPGKVNPVIPEMVIQVAAHINGKTLAVTIGAQNGPLELNMMNPLIAYETLTSIDMLTRTCNVLAERCIKGITADAERCEHWIEWSLALVTPLATKIGYDRAAKLAYRAYKEGRTVREIATEEKVLPEAELSRLLDAREMV